MGNVVALGKGRPRKPTRTKALKGTLRGDRTNLAEPQRPPAKIPDPPAEMNDIEKASWLELGALVDPLSVATASDVYAFRRMVETAAMLVSLRQSFIASGGEPVYAEQTKGGSFLRVRPEVTTIPTYEKLMLLHMSRWGLNPADRSRVSALRAETPKTNPLKKFGLGATLAENPK